MPTYALDDTHRRGSPPEFQSTSLRKIFLFLLKCGIMMVVFSIFLFFLGFAAVILLHFLFTSNAFHRRFFSPSDAAARSVASSATNAFESPNIQSRLTNVPYKAAAFQRTRDCAICLDSFQEGESCRSLPVCKHLFHAKCVDRWIRKRPNCPICRSVVDSDDGLLGPGVTGNDSWKRLWPIGFGEGNSHY